MVFLKHIAIKTIKCLQSCHNDFQVLSLTVPSLIEERETERECGRGREEQTTERRKRVTWRLRANLCPQLHTCPLFLLLSVFHSISSIACLQNSLKYTFIFFDTCGMLIALISLRLVYQVLCCFVNSGWYSFN